MIFLGYKSNYYLEKLLAIITRYADKNVDEKIKKKYQVTGFPLEFQGELVNKSVHDLLDFVDESNDDLAYCILGYFIMRRGAKMSKPLKKSSCHQIRI